MRPLLGVVGAPSAGKAIGLIVAGVTLFSISDVAAKQLSERLPSLEITWLRYLTLSIVAVLFAARGGGEVVRARVRGPSLRVAIMARAPQNAEASENRAAG